MKLFSAFLVTSANHFPLLSVSGIGLVNVMRVDDPVGCVGVHWGAGLWAMIATGFFANTDKIQGGDEGIFRGGSGKMLGMNIAFSLAVTLWSGGLTALQVSKLSP